MILRRITPALVAFTALFSGCLAAGPRGSAPHVLLALAAVAMAAAIPLAAQHARVLTRAGVIIAAAGVGLFLAAVSAGRMGCSTAAARPALEPSRITGFTARLRQDSTLTKNGRTLLYAETTEVRSESLRVRSRVPLLVFLQGDYRFFMGERVEVRAGLVPFESQGPEALAAYVSRADVTAMGFSGPLWELRGRLREGIHRSLDLAGYPASALLEALLVGGREDVPVELSDGFRKSGSLHILALSGLHAAVIYAAVSLILSFTSRRLLKYLLSTAVLAFYLFLAGPLPSLERAVLMLAIGGAAALRDRDAEPLNALSLAGIAILVIDPHQAWSVSFQLSMLSLLGLIVAAPLFVHALDGVLPRVILMPLAASASAQIATLPVVLAVFGEYYPSGLLAGLILIPLTTFMLWLGLAWLLISPLAGAALHHAAAPVFGALYNVIQGSAGVFAGLPGILVTGAGGAAAAACAGVLLFGVCLAPPWIPRLGRRQVGAGHRLPALNLPARRSAE